MKPRRPREERGLAGAIALGAMFLAIVAICVLSVAIHGPDDLVALAESAAQGQPRAELQSDTRQAEEREVEAAVALNRFATGLSP